MINPPHEAKDTQKVAALVEAFRINSKVPPVVAYQEQGISGSHRIAALIEAKELWNNMADGWDDSEEPELEIVEMTDADYDSACEYAERESIFESDDWTQICEWVYESTGSDEIKSALEDQV